MLYEDQNAHNLKQQYDELQNEIADILLGTDSPVRGFAEFDKLISEHDRLLSRQAELKTLETKLTKVLPGLEQAEGNLTAAQKHLAAEKKKIADYAGELGESAFAGLRSGELPDHQIFSDRKELQSRIENLQRQRSELTAGKNAGLMDKAKLQAQQLKLTGQIKIEELRIKSVDRALGETILKSKEKLSVRCDQTEDVIQAISNQRNLVAAARDQVKQAEQVVERSRSYTAKILARASVQNSDYIKKELRNVGKEVRQSEQETRSIRCSTVAKALETDSIPSDTTVAERITQLRQVTLELKSSETSWTILVEHLATRSRVVPRKYKYGICSIAGLALLLVSIGFLGEDTRSVHPSREGMPHTNGSEAKSAKRQGQPGTLDEELLTRIGAKVKTEDDGTLQISVDDCDESELALLPKLGPFQKLVLYSCVIGEDGLKPLANIQSLEILFIHHSEMDKPGFHHLAKLRGISDIDLTGSTLTTSDIEEIARIKSLEFLGLSSTTVSDDSLTYLRDLPHLESLHLSECKGVTDAGLNKVRLNLKGLPALNFLSLKGTSVSPEFRKYLLPRETREMFAKLPQSLSNDLASSTIQAGDPKHPAMRNRTVESSATNKARWRRPTEVYDQILSLDRRAKEGVRHVEFSIVERLDTNRYHVIITGQAPATARWQIPAIILTSTVKYTTKGKANLRVRYRGSKQLKMADGFQKDFQILEESPGITWEQFAVNFQQVHDDAKGLRQQLIAAVLHEYPTKPGKLSALELMTGKQKKGRFASLGLEADFSNTAFGVMCVDEIKRAAVKTEYAWRNGFSPLEFAACQHDVKLLDWLVAIGEGPIKAGKHEQQLINIATKQERESGNSFFVYGKDLSGITEAIQSHAN